MGWVNFMKRMVVEYLVIGLIANYNIFDYIHFFFTLLGYFFGGKLNHYI